MAKWSRWNFGSFSGSRLPEPGARIDAPPFKMYYPTASAMDAKQREFYEYWKSKISNGVALDVGENVSYVFSYCYEVQEQKEMQDIYDTMCMLATAYASNAPLYNYCKRWAADALIGLKRFEDALHELPEPALDRTESLQADLTLSLKCVLGKPISGEDILTLYGPSVTEYGRQNLQGIAQYITAVVSRSEVRSGDTIQRWTKTLPIWKGDHHLFGGSPAGRSTSNLTVYGYSRSREIQEICKELIREGENTFREERGVPRIGEGWVSETELYYSLKSAFPEWDVIHHGRPKWLIPQHLDVWIESIKIAVEYQGSQHDLPVAYFGGEEGFARTRERDERKHALCSKHGIELNLCA